MDTPENETKFQRAAYGGPGWSPRMASHAREIGSIWQKCGLDSEWKPLKSVLLHAPGVEFELISDPNKVQMLQSVHLETARRQHNGIMQAYQQYGIQTYLVDPPVIPSPNLIFCADLFLMTPEGAILSRPASTVRAGEERWIARRLSDIGIPILRSLQGEAVFEAADVQWLNRQTVVLGRGLRTNDEAIRQVTMILSEMGVTAVPIDLPIGCMHLMGILRFLDSEKAMIWPYRLAWKAADALKKAGYRVLYLPDEGEASQQGAFNFVSLGPSQVLMPAEAPITRSFLESHGVACYTVDMSELHKAAGGIGCLTGILERQMD